MHDEPNVRDAGAFAAQVRNKIDRKTKPIGALGRLEDLATRICHIQQRLDPQLTKPTVLVFAGDAAIRLETAQPLCFIEDLDEPWPTKWRPRHAAHDPGGRTAP